MNPLRVRLMGPTDVATAFARVNARWAAGLRALGHTVRTDDDRDGPDDVDVALVHDFSRPFTRPDLPLGLPRIAVRSWDFGPFPPAWVDTVVDHYDELWVYSAWTADLARRGGVPADRVRVVPLGVDPAVHRPDGPAHPLTAGAATTLLYVGAGVRRKGLDALVDAYADAFTAGDDVQLIVKDHTGDLFYGDQGLGDRVVALATGHGPRARYVDEDLAAADLAALYRGADALVLPYRAEGFALTPLEAMACGTAPVVPRFGAALDYTDETTAWYVPARRIALPVDRSMPYNSLGMTVRVAEVDFCEPDRRRLADLLRRIADEPAPTRSGRGRAAAREARRWSWAASIARVADGLEEVASRAGR